MIEEPASPLFIRLYLDEDVFQDVAFALRRRGFDAVSVHELGHYEWSDADHLAYATAHGRALFSFNAVDYLALHKTTLTEGKHHAGIIVSKQHPIRETIRRLLSLLNQVTADEMRDGFWWV
jgi:predicted nuclease of predicted toxin-antitoxin system